MEKTELIKTPTKAAENLKQIAKMLEVKWLYAQHIARIGGYTQQKIKDIDLTDPITVQIIMSNKSKILANPTAKCQK